MSQDNIKINNMKLFRQIIMVLATCLASVAYAVPLPSQTLAVRLTRFEGDKITGITISGGFEVSLSQGAKTGAVVEINKELEEYLIFSNDNGIIRIGLESEGYKIINKMQRRPHLVAKVTVSDLRQLRAAAGCRITMLSPIKTDDCDIKLSSSSSVSNLHLDANTLSMDISSGAYIEMTLLSNDLVRADLSSSAKLIGNIKTDDLVLSTSSGSYVDLDMSGDDATIKSSSASRVNIKGFVDNLSVSCSSGGSISASELTASDVNASVSSGASASVTANGMLKANASSGGSLVYSGNANIVSTNASSGGSVTRK